MVFDKLLYDTDRAIDLYLQSQDRQGNGPPEQRAAAFGVLIWLITDNTLKVASRPTGDRLNKTLDGLRRNCFVQDGEEPDPLDPHLGLSELARLLLKPLPEKLPLDSPDVVCSERIRRMRNELCMQRRTEERWFRLAEIMTPVCINVAGIGRMVDDLLAAGLYALGSYNMACSEIDDDIPPDLATSLADLAYERPSDGHGVDNDRVQGDF